MREPGTVVIDIIRAYHEDLDHIQTAPIALHQCNVERVCSLGLGPISYALSRSGALTAEAGVVDVLKGSDLSVRLIHQKMQSSVVRLLQSMNASGVKVGLLKGVSTSEDFYALSHHRVMGDIDILIAPSDVEIAQRIVAELGYRECAAEGLGELPHGHHHLPALQDPLTGTIVEIHSGLFSGESTAAQLQIFQRHSLVRYLAPSEYGGQEALRFRPEFQFIYTIAHWAADRKWPVNVFSVSDAISILNRYPDFDWSLLQRWMAESNWLACCVTVMLRFLLDHELIRARTRIDKILSHHERALGQANLVAFDWLMRNFPMRARATPPRLLSQSGARHAWQTMLEQRHRMLRLPAAASAVLFSKRMANKVNPIKIVRRLLK